LDIFACEWSWSRVDEICHPSWKCVYEIIWGIEVNWVREAGFSGISSKIDMKYASSAVECQECSNWDAQGGHVHFFVLIF
jgi:hypothetical protein